MTAVSDTDSTPSSIGSFEAPPFARVEAAEFSINGKCADDGELSPEEEKAVRLFLAHVNGWRAARNYAALTFGSAVKFLMARKFNVDRALVLYRQHEMMRIREGLGVLDADSLPLKQELRTQKFTVLPTRDPKGAAVAVFNSRLHEPSDTTHRSTLQAVIHQLDVAMEDAKTQRAGIVFVYNMYGSKYSNFDYDLSQKMLTMLKGCYPARLKKVLIVTAPLWFRAPFKVLRLFVREKLRDRVSTVSVPQLMLHIPPASLPKELGGMLEHDHEAWLDKCRNARARQDGKLVTLNFTQQSSSSDDASPTLEQLQELPVDLLSSSNGARRRRPSPLPPPPPPPIDEDDCRMNQPDPLVQLANRRNDDEKSTPEEEEAVSTDDEILKEEEVSADGHGLQDFIEHVRVKGRKGLYDEYAEIRSRAPTGTFVAAKSPENVGRNRYTDVLCYDHSRVRLRHDSGDDDDGETDYINANFVDGYRQKNAFIFTQGPLPNTFKDFWAMVWQQEVLVVVMTTKAVERNRTKCGQYWPELNVTAGYPIVTGNFAVSAEQQSSSNVVNDYVVTRLTLTNMQIGESRPLTHFQFVSWPDYGVPDSAMSMLTFLQKVRETQAEMVSRQLGGGGGWTGHPLGPPIVVHCSAGIGRTGTFATLDICIRKFESESRVDVRSTVQQIRSQRAYSIQMPDQYVFCHLAFLEYALNMEYVDEIDLSGFDDHCDSD